MLTLVPLRNEHHIALHRDVDEQHAIVDALVEQGARITTTLGDRAVWMVNSTQTGGGVAEMLPTICGLMTDLGIPTQWVVIGSQDPIFFNLTKKLHNYIHGLSLAGKPTILDEERAAYDHVQQENAMAFLEHLGPKDVLIIHDPQPAGMAPMLKEAKPGLRLIWQCHIGVPFENEATQLAWNFLEPYLATYEHAIFTSDEYVPDFLRKRLSLNPPAIDPLSHKNRVLPMERILAILNAAGLYASSITSAITDLIGQVKTILPNGCLSAPAHLPLLGSPICLEVSRWDHLKGFIPLLKGFGKMKAQVLSGQYVSSQQPRPKGRSMTRERFMDSPRAAGDQTPASTASVRGEAPSGFAGGGGRREPPMIDEEARHALYESRLVLAGPDPSGVADDPEGVQTFRDIIDFYVSMPDAVKPWIHILLLPMHSRKENALIVNALQRSASVIIQNSLQEGFGLTATEAMWKRVPLLATTAGGLRLQVRDKTDGLLIQDAENADEIAEKIIWMLTHRQEREAMALHAHARVAQNFLVTRQVKDYLDLVETYV